MKIIIAGSRNINDYELVESSIRESGWLDADAEIVSGTARGVDTLALRFAVANFLPVHRFPARWEEYGKAAGMIRNKEMADFADALIAIWDGKSRGTKGMIDIARKNGLKVFVKRTDVGTVLVTE